MRTVPNDYELTVEDPDVEIDVEIDYRCFFAPNQAFAPMTAWTSVSKNYPLQKVIARGKADYEKQYQKVEVMAVRIDD
jgi:hypothetical protein